MSGGIDPRNWKVEVEGEGELFAPQVIHPD